MSSLIKADHLYRFYGTHCAVNDVSISLQKGQVLGFLGPNGAGKTTIMQMLCGNLAPSSGQIIINGIDLLDEPKSAKLHLGYLPDVPPLYRELTVYEFLNYCAHLHRIARGSLENTIQTAIERCGLKTVSTRLITNLSKGFQQRVGIAQAIIHNPDIIILDEPTIGLDPIQIREIRSLIKELGQDHGIILSSHMLSEVQEICTDVQIIQDGHLILNETIQGLNQQMNTTVLELVTRNPVDYNSVRAVPGVNSVEGISEQYIRIHYEYPHNPSEQIAELVVNAGWGLLELKHPKKTLEDIFISLTGSRVRKDIRGGKP